MVSPALAQGYLNQQYDPKMRRDQPQSSDDQMRRDEQARRDKGMRPDDRARRNDHGNRDQQSNRNGGMRRDERGNYNSRGHDDRDHQRHCGTVGVWDCGTVGRYGITIARSVAAIDLNPRKAGTHASLPAATVIAVSGAAIRTEQ